MLSTNNIKQGQQTIDDKIIFLYYVKYSESDIFDFNETFIKVLSKFRDVFWTL